MSNKSKTNNGKFANFHVAPDSISRKFTRNPRLRSLKSSIKGLFVTKKPNVTRLNHKNRYFHNYYFSKSNCEWIAMIAKADHISKQDTVDMLVGRGFSVYIGEKIRLHVLAIKAAREFNEKKKMGLYISILKKYARKQGIDLPKSSSPVQRKPEQKTKEEGDEK